MVQSHSEKVPFFRPSITENEIAEVERCLRSGWLTTGPRTKQFEEEFAAAVQADYAIALNSCTAALHLAVEALGLKEGQGVLVPTMTFAATAEVVRYQGGIPILVDCDPRTLNINLQVLGKTLDDLRSGKLPVSKDIELVGIMPVHVGGFMVNMDEIKSFATKHSLWVVEDAAHALPAAYRTGPHDNWKRCGEGTADVTCYSFYANKTITTGEGGMAVTNSEVLEKRIRQMALHGLSRDAWNRFQGGSWDYQIQAPGYKYNLTDIASSLGIHQLRQAENFQKNRQRIAEYYDEHFSDSASFHNPPSQTDRMHSWHLYPIQLKTENLSVTRDVFLDELAERGIGTSVHWRPLHLHPYYKETFHWCETDFPHATKAWERLISLPIFPSMTQNEMAQVVKIVESLGQKYHLRQNVLP